MRGHAGRDRVAVRQSGDAEYADALASALEGADVESLSDVGDLLASLATEPVDCVVYELPDGAGDAALVRSVLAAIDARAPGTPVVVVGPGDSRLASEAVAHGVAGFVPTGISGVTALLAANVRRVLDDTAKADARDRDVAPGTRSDRELLDDIFESLPVHLFVKDREGRHVRISHAFVDDPGSFIGKTDLEVDVVSTAHAREALADDSHVVETGEPIIDKVERLPKFDQWNLTSKVPWVDADGTVVGVIGVSRDVSERVERLAALRRQNERLEEFASALSHDLRNPLAVAQGYLNLAIEGADDRTPELAETAAALDRIEALVTDVLALARHGTAVVDPEPVDLDAVVPEAWSDVDAPNATLETDPLPTVLGDRSHLRRLFVNLFRNALDHAGDDVTVSVQRVEDGPAPDDTVPAADAVSVADLADNELPPEHTAEEPVATNGTGFAVADDGPGIPPGDRESVFDRGYTTDDEGTGFGLAIVQSIVQAHGWSVAVGESEAGGARFTVWDVETADDAP